jgi:hypothetical protein
MVSVAIFCPETQREVDTGISTDELTFTRLLRLSARARCPICGEEHGPVKRATRLLFQPVEWRLPLEWQ